MIDFESIAPKVWRIVAYGEFEQADAEKLVAFVRERQGEGEDGVHVLLDLVSLSKISFSAVSEELANLPMLMRYLYSLDRIAIVSDQEWIRAAARIESALLPGVEYEVYEEDEVETARAWVLGESEHPRGGAVRELDRGDDIAAFEITGRIDRDEAERIIDLARAKLAAPDCSKLMVVIRKWQGFDADVMTSGKVVPPKLDMIGDIERYAVVGGPDWLRGAARMANGLFGPSMRSFELEEEDAALEWLRG